MAKKAKTASWRTLTRRADRLARQKQPTAAFALRRKAAALRRADRAASVKKAKTALPVARRNIAGATRATKGWATRRANQMAKAARDDQAAGGLRALVAQAPQAPQGINRDSSQAWRQEPSRVAGEQTSGAAPGHGEIVGGAMSQLADRLAKLARKKGGTDAIQNELLALCATANYEGCVETDKSATARLIEVQQIMADRIVCGFLAEIEHTMNFHRGLPPGMVHTIDSYTITKIVDALNKAGYRATGKT